MVRHPFGPRGGHGIHRTPAPRKNDPFQSGSISLHGGDRRGREYRFRGNLHCRQGGHAAWERRGLRQAFRLPQMRPLLAFATGSARGWRALRTVGGCAERMRHIDLLTVSKTKRDENGDRFSEAKDWGSKKTTWPARQTT